jgi:type II secretory pathway component PulJ
MSILRNSKGIAITELLVSIAISGVVVAAIYLAHNIQRTAYEVTLEVTSLQQDIRAAIHIIAKDIRTAGYVPPPSSPAGGFHNIADTTVLELSYDGAVPGAPADGTVNDPGEHIYYRRNAADNTLQRQVGVGGYQTFAENISAFTWTFFDENGQDVTADPNLDEGDVKAVEITLGASQGQHKRQLSSRIVCRNAGRGG